MKSAASVANATTDLTEQALLSDAQAACGGQSRLRSADRLNATARDRLMDDLIQFGSSPSDEQRLALSRVLSTYTGLAFGNITGRHAAALPTGTGKTRSIVRWLWAVNERGLSDASRVCDNISVIVCASKVEALCRLKRDLLETGVPEQSIGLVHSYKFDPELAAAYLAGNLESLPAGYASEPVTEDYENRPFLLLTHQRVKGKNGIAEFNLFRGKPRSLVIWDESLLSSETFAFEDDRVRASWAWLREMDRMKTPQRDEALAYLGDAIEKIKSEIQVQQEDPSRSEGTALDRKERVFRLAPLTEDQIENFKSALGSGEQAELLKDLLDISQEELRVLAHIEQGGGVITFRVSVPKELENIVVLDASYPIRELSRLDPSIRQLDIPSNIVSYSEVTVYQLDHASGRGAMEKEFSKRRGHNKVAQEVAEVIKGIPENEAILIFTFKGRGKLNYQQQLERELEANGIDVDSKVLVKGDGSPSNGVLKPRVNFLTWGNETSLNQFSYCSNVILCGIIHRSHIDIGGAIIGQAGDILRPVTNPEIRQVVQSEVAHAAYQALSRGSSRVIQGNRTLPMKVWLIHPERENLRGRLEQVMPGVNWVKWEPRYLLSKKDHRRENSKTAAVAQTISAYLDSLPGQVTSVSVRKMKAELSLNNLSPMTANRAFKQAVKNTGWTLSGRTVVRTFTHFFGDTGRIEGRTADQNDRLS